MTKAIEITGLTKVYSNGRGISDLNLEIDTGDIFGFLGPNGAGKTTAMKMMAGLVKPDRGDVRIFGASVFEDYVQAMKPVGCMIETAESYPYMTANDNLKLFARFYPDIDQRRIDECLEITGMLKYKNEKSRKFSLGMKQRLGIAAAILSRPKLLILDEPLNGLDVEGMLEMRKLIKRLSQDEGTTFFISSHLIHDVELTCNRIGVVYGGKLVNVDYTSSILSNYASLENYFVSEVDRSGRI
ncbi:ABC transporter ATP-binding protein [Paenibacillus mucilaginosus]|uniref:ABC transporter n=2 Tax=Paenibacillus mucilaginosus TaxID=61624 RepID=I0BLG7_9BACL|nr:ABC transporter ATP-binding protein [Paenibacillus mucilaginosus]AEI43231.1 ABC transporter related protein [Paenibacillus mucilaginosus KNP414]AFH63214.1 ABC transporter [Paenibacillus mucilaginosus K02]MCG7212213.1 ABC transporter ATP-binding protein [Paenibacillus mucilaginosus]WDM24820.1 ABC transporter ATP-binding protein [Paenibacillus mucilaginosus]